MALLSQVLWIRVPKASSLCGKRDQVFQPRVRFPRGSIHSFHRKQVVRPVYPENFRNTAMGSHVAAHQLSISRKCEIDLLPLLLDSQFRQRLLHNKRLFTVWTNRTVFEIPPPSSATCFTAILETPDKRSRFFGHLHDESLWDTMGSSVTGRQHRSSGKASCGPNSDSILSLFHFAILSDRANEPTLAVRRSINGQVSDGGIFGFP
jgi:hypothetical protein